MGDLGSIPGLGRSPQEGKGYPLQYSGLENSMDCIVHGVTKSRTRLSDFHKHNVKHSQTLMTFSSAAYQSRFLFWVISSYKHLPFKILHWLFPWPLKFNIKMESHYFYSWACSFFDVAYVALEIVSTLACVTLHIPVFLSLWPHFHLCSLISLSLCRFFFYSYAISFISIIYFITWSLHLLFSFTYFTQSPTPNPRAVVSLFSISISLFLFCLVHLFFRFHYKWSHRVFVFGLLIYFT